MLTPKKPIVQSALDALINRIKHNAGAVTRLLTALTANGYWKETAYTMEQCRDVLEPLDDSMPGPKFADALASTKRMASLPEVEQLFASAVMGMMAEHHGIEMPNLFDEVPAGDSVLH